MEDAEIYLHNQLLTKNNIPLASVFSAELENWLLHEKNMTLNFDLIYTELI